MGRKRHKTSKHSTKGKRKKRHSNSVQPPLEEDPDQTQAKKKKLDSELPGEAGTSAEVNLPAKAADEHWKISDNNVTSTTEIGEETQSTFYDASTEIPTTPVLEKLQIDQMPCETGAFFNKASPALSPVTVPHLSTNRNGKSYTKSTPEDTLTPSPPINEHPVPGPSTSGAGKAGKPHRTVEEDVQREEKEKYKQLLKLLKDKYAKYLPTPKPTSCRLQAYSRESVVFADYLKEQNCLEDACQRVVLETDGSGSRHSLESDVTRYYIPAEKEDETREEKQASAGEQCGDAVSGQVLFQLRPAPVFSSGPCAFDVEEEKFPGSEGTVEEFPPLTEDMEREITAALGRGRLDEVMSSAFKLRITRNDIQTLSEIEWINDEIINFYMNLLMERSKKEGYPAVYAFSTFFYPKLLSDGYGAVRRWTRKVNLFEHDIILVPIHLRAHWRLVVIDLRKKTITYFDSFSKKGDKICENIFQYLQEESWEKQNVKLSASEWTHHSMESHEIPQQFNGSDCGVFMCKYADYVSRDKPITFTQDHMPYFRRRMVWEIIHQQLL